MTAVDFSHGTRPWRWHRAATELLSYCRCLNISWPNPYSSIKSDHETNGPPKLLGHRISDHHSTNPKIISLALLSLTLVVSCAHNQNESTNAVWMVPQQLASESSSAFNARNYPLAQSLAAQATAAEPKAAEAWVVYGMASAKLGQPDRAKEGYQHALALHRSRHLKDPSDADQVFQEFSLKCA